MGGDEVVVSKVGIGAADAVELLALAGGEALSWVQAPDALQKALPPQYFVDAGYAAVKVVCAVENGGVGVGELDAVGEPMAVVERAGCAIILNRTQHRDRLAGPDSPLAQKPADDAQRRRVCPRANVELCEQVGDDIVVVAGVERDLAGAA